jgi:hypothetical protein
MYTNGANRHSSTISYPLINHYLYLTLLIHSVANTETNIHNVYSDNS